MRSFYEIHFEIENSCLLNCMHCSSVSLITLDNNIGYSIEQMSNFVGLLNGDIFVNLTGGEPLLNKNLHTYLSILRNKVCNVGLFTCGLLPQSNEIFSEISLNYAKALKKIGLTFCYVSMYSFKENNHDSITRISGSFEKTVKTIKNLILADIEVNINFVLLKDNIGQIREHIEYFRSLNVKGVRLLKLVNHGNAAMNWPEIGVPYDAQDIILEDIAKTYINKYPKISLAGFPQISNCRPCNGSIKCQAGSKLFYVNFEGDIYPCACVKNNIKYKIGHISELSKLSEYIKIYSMNFNEICLNRIER